VVSVQSRECGEGLLRRLAGSTRLPERPVGAAIVSVVRRAGGSLLCVTAPAMIDADEQVDYFLGLLPLEHPEQLRREVVLVAVDDDSSRWLSDKLVPDTEAMRLVVSFVAAHKASGDDVRLSYFEPSTTLRGLAQRWELPDDQAGPEVIPLGGKGAGRKVFAAAGVPVPAGTPEVHDVDGLVSGIQRLADQGVRRFVIKLSSTEYASGFGNALLDLDTGGVESAKPIDPALGWPEFAAQIPLCGAVAEERVAGDGMRSPSFQGRIDDDGAVHTVSTHDQVLGGAGLTYVGCAFPADAAYRATVVNHGQAVGAQLAASGVRGGDYGVDFLAVPDPRHATGWRVLGCEINLRSTGTKHGFTMATALLGVTPTPEGTLVVDGEERVYQCFDVIADPALVGLRPRDLIAAIGESDLHFDPVTMTGAALHMLSAITESGKFGATCIGRTQDECTAIMRGVRELALERAASLTRS
jgi:hypothetical protein